MLRNFKKKDFNEHNEFKSEQSFINEKLSNNSSCSENRGVSRLFSSGVAQLFLLKNIVLTVVA